ncbi:amino acid adenylation [Pseudovirgaria hyperparasitica]|uniref:Amino acid adenylation n=1 Tax=Pseudovirgaria hyperparasitica TaxID=470096 RepID=A0A6A6VTU2_9PEZI|nr:amino acid adenylation [Pseudovirgaria hyperparasitica]KAF2753565.1 amino acid adenylation [Pseudovirgaria hyperparasitica]
MALRPDTFPSSKDLSSNTAESLGVISNADHQHLRRFNANEVTSVDVCLHDIIRERCLERADAPAVFSSTGQFSYRELDTLSTHLALRLISYDVGPESFVPLLFEKSRWTSIAMLGVLKAGGAFILMDPSHPRRRLQEICDTSRAKLVVCSSQQQPLASQLMANVVIVDCTDDTNNKEPDTEIHALSKATPENAVYCVFTSGSTGKPKGVVIEHRNYCTALVTQKEAFGLDEQTRYLQFASYAFDTSISDHFMTWLAGGCVCVLSDSERRDSFSEVAVRLKANVLDLTPSLARLIRPDSIPCAKALVLGGEAMKPHDVDIWADKVRLINGYGPSECSVTATLTTSVKPGADPTNIGYPVGCIAWIVDPDNHNTLLGPGAVGELVLEGPIVGRGYLHEPEKTAAVFVSNPSWVSSFRGSSYEGRFYKTGDLARLSERDGSIFFCGRKDNQIKIRGQRLEAGEVENVIAQCLPMASSVLVTTISSRTSSLNHILAAFIEMPSLVAENDEDARLVSTTPIFTRPTQITRKKLTDTDQTLAAKLPSYMRPTKYFTLYKFPVSINGKTDVKLLQSKADSLSAADLDKYTGFHQTRRVPYNEAEKVLQMAFAELFNREPESVGLDDSFFDLGGDSLLAISLVNRLRKFSVQIQVSEILRHPKISDLAASVCHFDKIKGMRIDTRGLISAEFGFTGEDDLFAAASTKELPSTDIQKVLPLTEAQQVRLRESLQYFIFDFAERIDDAKLLSACRLLAERHEILRVVFRMINGQIGQVIPFQPPEGLVQSRMESGNLDDQVSKLCSQDDLTLPPLDRPITRFTHISTPSSRSVLVIRLSHAQFDGYALEVLFSDLQALYEDQALAPATQYSAHIEELLRQKSSSESIDFWRSRLSGHLITHLPSGPSPMSSPQWSLPTLHTPPIPPVEGITLATIVNAAWSLILVRLTQHRPSTLSALATSPNLSPVPVVFGMMTNGRNSGRVSDTTTCVGLCTNTILLRVAASADLTVHQLLIDLQNQYIDAMAHELVELPTILGVTAGRTFTETNTMVPGDGDFGSVVNFRGAEVEGKGPLKLSGVPGTRLERGVPPRRRQVILIAVQQRDQIWLKIAVPDYLLNEDQAREVLVLMSELVIVLAKNIKSTLKEIQWA